MVKMLLVLLFSISATAVDKPPTFTFYKNKLLKTKTFSDGYKITAKYDKRTGKLSQVTKPGITYKFVYGKDKNLKLATKTGGGKVDVTYYPKGQISSLTSGNVNLTFMYEPKFNKPMAIVLNHSDLLFVKYGDNGQIVLVTSPSGQATAIQISKLFNQFLVMVDPKLLFARE